MSYCKYKSPEVGSRESEAMFVWGVGPGIIEIIYVLYICIYWKYVQNIKCKPLM